MSRFLVVTGLLLSLMLSGCGKPSTPTNKNNDENSQKNDSTTGTDAPLQYPELYTNEKLPQYSKATLTSTGRQTTSLKDGLALDLTSTDDVQTIAKFYEKELNTLGWKVPVPKFRSDDMFIANCSKGQLTYNVTITKMPAGKPTTIHIAFLSK